MSLRKAADAMCKGCVYDPLVKGTWREQVEECACTDCPLFKYRPMTGAAINARRAAARADGTTEQEEAQEDEALAA